MSQFLKVETVPNGPLRVANCPSLKFGEETIPLSGDAYLCRCGQSARAPFCDGTHRTAAFSDAVPAREPAPVRVWEGRTIRTTFNPNACMHVFYFKPLDALRAEERAGSDAAATEIARVVGSCPSGALTWTAIGEVEVPTQGHRPMVEVMEGGEIRIQAAFESTSLPAREGLPEDRATLCRCGLSAAKPFCDGRHKGKKDFR